LIYKVRYCSKVRALGEFSLNQKLTSTTKYFILSTMLSMNNNRDEGCRDISFDTEILEQSFSQLPSEGKVQLRDYLQNLISIQNTIATADIAGSSSKDE